MAKTVKFNLVLDGYPIRDIDSFKENFIIEDVLKYFKSGLLQRWLNVREYSEEHAAVEKIDKNADNRHIITEIIKIFGMSPNSDKMNEELCLIDYAEEEMIRNRQYFRDKESKDKIISDYYKEYRQLIGHMIDNKDNLAVLKADAIILEKNYYHMFELDYGNLYYYLLNNAPMAIFAILMRNSLRKFWEEETVDEEIIKNENSEIGAYNQYTDKKYTKAIWTSMKADLLRINNAVNILGENLKHMKRNTQAMWDNIVPSDVKVMVIHIQDGCFVKNHGVFDEKISSKEINLKARILNGIDFQSTSDCDLYYLEV